jgi:hypothetical protein
MNGNVGRSNQNTVSTKQNKVTDKSGETIFIE